jgi:tetratricopeptide (TPR) repeat protein
MDVWILRGQRAGLLLLCVFLALNPVIGLRHILAHEMNLSLPLLSLDYLNGLAAGFLAGKLILLHGEDFTRRRRTGWRLELQVSRAVFPILTVLCLAIVLLLIVRNVPVVTQANRNSLAEFGELAWHSLPPEGGVLLSDFPEKLMVFQAAQARHTSRPAWLAVDVKSLPTPEYRARLDRLRPGLWLSSTNRHNLTPPEMVYVAAQLLKHDRVFYLNPNSGFWGEVFYAQPAGSVYELKKYGTDPVELPATPPEAIARTEKTWDDFAPQLESLQRAGGEDSPLTTGFEKALLLERVSFNQITVLDTWYSVALNAWGVDLQRNGSLPAAQRRFTESLALRPENWIAGVNLTVNSNLLAGIEMNGAENHDLAQKLGDVGTIQKLGAELNLFGPVDEPSLCLMLGNFFEQQQEPRMAFQQFGRARTLAPGALAPKFALATLFVRYHLNDQALKIIKNLHAEASGGNVNPEWDLQVSFLEAKLWLSQTNSVNARRILGAVAGKYGKRPGVLDRVAETYLEYNDMTNAEPIMEGLLAAEPDDQAALLNQSRVFILARHAEAAIPILDHLLTLTNLPEARFNRAQAYMMAQNFAAAKNDYLDLLSTPVNQFLVDFNLGKIAVHDHDTNLATQYYSVCLSNTPPGSIQWQTASNQLHELGVRGY